MIRLFYIKKCLAYTKLTDLVLNYYKCILKFILINIVLCLKHSIEKNKTLLMTMYNLMFTPFSKQTD